MKKTKVSEVVLNNQRKGASISTQVKNTFEAYRAGVATGEYSSEYAYAKCGCCKEKIPKIDGVWDQTQYEFLKSPYGTSNDINQDHLRVHPSLWNNGTNNVLSGVFEVLPGKIYQVRGYDMANITFVKTNNVSSSVLSENDRWMVMDTLMSKECTRAALRLFSQHLCYVEINTDGINDEKDIDKQHFLYGKITGMIVSHSHIDHYGGMPMVKEWFIDETVGAELDKIAEAKVEERGSGEEYKWTNHPFILAPYGFFEHSVSENVYVGNAMGRRASYQYGSFIKPAYTEAKSVDDYLSGEISIGIGQGQSTGNTSFEVPTMEIGENCTLILDNLEVGFQLTPGTEAPAEMNNYFSDYNALWLAENCNGTLHNLYTLRGAQVRDGKAWARYLMETVVLYGDEAKVIFQSHNWPHWDNSLDSECVPTNGVDDKFPRTDLKAFLIDTAAIYKYINDQTLLYMNMGYKMNEASDMLTLPRAMQKNWCLKPFYGTPKHNAKAVYQRYLGWYDANPLHLEELPPEQLAQEQLRYMMAGGSTDNILKMIEDDIQKGNYWTAAYMAHRVVIGGSSPGHVVDAKHLCADALEQLGYQSESGTWRNAYLSAAYELRSGKGRVSASGGSMIEHLTTEMILDYISILFDGERGSNISFDGYLSVQLTDDNNVVVATENFLFVVRNGAILYSSVSKIPDRAELIKVNKNDLIQIVTGVTENSEIKLSGVLLKIFYCVIRFEIDRYKYFDIMGKHDSEVLIEHTEYALYDVVLDCFNLLQKYASREDLSTNETTGLEYGDKLLWEEYREILVDQTNLLLDGDFFDPSNVLAGIGTDDTFFAHELYYNMFSLLRYLNAPYIKNDFNFRGKDTELEAYIKIKEKIKLLETYLPDCYLKDNGYTVQFDTDDISALNCLDKKKEIKNEGMSISDFMQKLYECHTTLAEYMGVLKDRTSIINYAYFESDKEIKLNYELPCDGEFVIEYGANSVGMKGRSGQLILDVSGEEDRVKFTVFQQFGEIKKWIKSLVFCKPQICITAENVQEIKFQDSISGDYVDVEALNTDSEHLLIPPYGFPEPDNDPDNDPDNEPDSADVYYKYTLTYETKYVAKLIIEDHVMTDAEKGTFDVSFQEGQACVVPIKAYTENGYYVSIKYDCKNDKVIS